MLPVGDKPLVHYSYEEAKEAGIEEITFIIGPNQRDVVDYFTRNLPLEQELEARGKPEAAAAIRDYLIDGPKIHFVVQEEAKGLGHAVWLAREHIRNEPFMVLLPDDLILAEPGKPSVTKQMIDTHQQVGGGHIISTQKRPVAMSKRYGVFDVESGDKVAAARSLVEKPAPENAPAINGMITAVLGRWLVESSILEELEKGKRTAGNEIQLTDAIGASIGTVPVYSFNYTEPYLDCGNPAGFLEANIAVAKRMAVTNQAMQATLQTLCSEQVADRAAEQRVAA
jgi:UTP--glucose-1-phosphate uridylyltransferase